MIHVIATIELHPGQRERFLEHFRVVVPLVLREAGCLEYGPTIDLEHNLSTHSSVRDDVVTVVEKWDDLGSLEAHLVAAHMLAYREKVQALVKQVRLQVLEPA